MLKHDCWNGLEWRDIGDTELDSSCADALLHRSNLYMIQGKPEEAKLDLEKSVRLHPNHVMVQLRLASILAATQDFYNAK